MGLAERYTIVTSCDARVTETWTADLPEGSALLSDDDLRELAMEQVFEGGAELVSERVHDEYDRIIEQIELKGRVVEGDKDLGFRLRAPLAERGHNECRPAGHLSAETVQQVREALEGDSNDAEHNALVLVAEELGIAYDGSGGL